MSTAESRDSNRFQLGRNANPQRVRYKTAIFNEFLGALLFFFPQDLIQIQHYSATKAGAAFSPFVLIMLVLSRWAGRLVERYGARLPLTIGPLIATVGYATFALIWSDLSTPAHSWCCF